MVPDGPVSERVDGVQLKVCCEPIGQNSLPITVVQAW